MCSGAPRDPSVIRSGKITAMCFKEEAKEHAKAVKATIAMFRIAIPPNSTGKVALSYHSTTSDHCSLPGHEEEEQGRGRRQGFLPPTSKKGVPMIMEPLVYLSVTATTLTRHLAYLRQAMAMLHVVYASISILLDMGGAGLIRDLGGIIST